MDKVLMLVSGKPAMVDADMVKKMQSKANLVNQARNLQDLIKNTNSPAKASRQRELEDIAGKIIRLNHTIRSTVQFL